MKRAIGAAVVCLLVAAGAAAQDYIFTNFQGGYKDFTVPTHPCGDAGMAGPAQPVTFDRSIWMIYTCGDHRVVARRFFHLVDVAPGAPIQAELPQTSGCQAHHTAVQDLLAAQPTWTIPQAIEWANRYYRHLCGQ
jgi:hypothetical protein